jgi:hypothetical protein
LADHIFGDFGGLIEAAVPGVGEFDDVAPAVGRVHRFGHQSPGFQAVDEHRKCGAVDGCQGAQLGLVERALLTQEQQYGELRIC